MLNVELGESNFTASDGELGESRLKVVSTSSLYFG